MQIVRWRSILGIAALMFVSTYQHAWANCIAHQPPNAVFTPPAQLRLRWECVTAGPLYEHERDWFIITFKVTNAGEQRIEALKLQANLIDAFGDVLRTVPIVERARLGNGDSDGAVWAFRPSTDQSSIDHVALYVLAVKYADGTTWREPGKVPQSGPTPPPRATLRRFSMRWDSYDMGDVIAPSPSPSASPH